MLQFDEPIIAPPREPKAFPILWIRNLQVQAHDTMAEGKLYLEIVPMAVDRELLPSATVEIQTDELFSIMEAVPEVAQAFAAILNCVKPLQAELQRRKEEKENESRTSPTNPS